MPSKTGTSGRAKAKAMTKNPFGALLSAVRRDIDARLSGFLDAKLESVREHGTGVTEMVGAVRDLCLRGGKRSRPALLVAGYRAASTRAKLEPALDAGVALELLHAYFLIHDDWMDRDELRRGGPSVHATLSRRFRSREIGEASAILAGDYAVALATEALARVDFEPSRAAGVFSCFAQMQVDAVLGQELDLLANARERFHYLSHALGGILIFVGVKMAVSHWFHLNTYVSLAVILVMLTAAIVLSQRKARRMAMPERPAAA